MAGAMPRTTAAMLDLDLIHRTRSPLGPLLRGKMRWVAAQANHCEYSMAYAEADLRRAGLDEAGLRSLKGDHEDLPEPERAALDFARQMTVDASEVTDAEVADLIAWYGEAKVVAMVLLLAYANFQDRLLLALGVPIEAGRPVASAGGPVRSRRPSRRRSRPGNGPRDGPSPRSRCGSTIPSGSPWSPTTSRDGSPNNGRRPSRIRVPSWEEVLRVMPPEMPRPEKPVRIRWSLVTMGYQPELAAAWSACTRAFGEEAKQDRVFEESLFWIVTRTIHCFY